MLIRTGYNLALLHEAESVFSELCRNGVPLILLKGLALAETVYGHIGERQFSDIDFLVRKRDFPLAQKVISESGYQVMQGSRPLYTKKKPWPVNLHVHSEIPYAVEEEIWSNLRSIRINDTEVYILAPVENLLYLIYHLAVSHGHPRDKWMKDIDRVIRHYGREIDWAEFTGKARDYGLAVPAYHTLLRASGLFGTPVPDSVVRRLRPKRNSVRSGICRLVFQEESPVPFAGYLMKALFFPRMAFSEFFPSPESVRRRRISSPLPVGVYYALRPLNLLFRGAVAVRGMFLRRLRKI